MPRLSKLLEKLEDQAIGRFGGWYDRHKEKFTLYIPAGLILWYVYGLFLNSLRLGIEQTFHDPNHEIVSIWVWNPFRNLLAVFTPFGLVTTLVIVLLTCLIMKKGYSRFSGYKYTHDSRGFDILPDATHGSSGFLTEKEMRAFLELGAVRDVTGMLLGKAKRHPDDPDKYALYVAHRMKAGDNNNLLCIGAPGSGKSRGFIIPFLMGVAQRKESVIVTDPKGELFEKLSPYFREHGHNVKAVNFLDMEHSDGWNCLYGLDTET
ncbi:MAG: type IV secretory system conjugative DNA transfer family protein, partial [Oscillospiraceae bacterium]|nr:type IV secretory system conjugative DNA transfer family protein [Oscillospiraceae bacterium]